MCDAGRPCDAVRVAEHPWEAAPTCASLFNRTEARRTGGTTFSKLWVVQIPTRRLLSCSLFRFFFAPKGRQSKNSSLVNARKSFCPAEVGRKWLCHACPAASRACVCGTGPNVWRCTTPLSVSISPAAAIGEFFFLCGRSKPHF